LKNNLPLSFFFHFFFFLFQPSPHRTSPSLSTTFDDNHQAWYFHKLAIFRAGNTVLTLLYATPNSERFGHTHLAATKMLLLLHALVPPFVKAVDAQVASSTRRSGSGAQWSCFAV
jgi:hypothetical protein